MKTEYSTELRSGEQLTAHSLLARYSLRNDKVSHASSDDKTYAEEDPSERFAKGRDSWWV